VTSSEVFQMIIALSVFAGAVALIPVLLQAKRTFKKAERLLDSLTVHAEPMCKSITEAADDLRELSVSLNDKVEKTDAIINMARHSVDTLHNTSNMLKSTVTPIITNVGGISAGIATFAHFLNKSRKTSKGEQ